MGSQTRNQDGGAKDLPAGEQDSYRTAEWLDEKTWGHGGQWQEAVFRGGQGAAKQAGRQDRDSVCLGELCLERSK